MTTNGNGNRKEELWKGCSYDFHPSVRYEYITEIVKSILKHITDTLNRPMKEIMKDYEYFVGQIFTYTHQSIKYLYRHSQG